MWADTGSLELEYSCRIHPNQRCVMLTWLIEFSWHCTASHVWVQAVSSALPLTINGINKPYLPKARAFRIIAGKPKMVLWVLMNPINPINGESTWLESNSSRTVRQQCGKGKEKVTIFHCQTIISGCFNWSWSIVFCRCPGQWFNWYSIDIQWYRIQFIAFVAFPLVSSHLKQKPWLQRWRRITLHSCHLQLWLGVKGCQMMSDVTPNSVDRILGDLNNLAGMVDLDSYLWPESNLEALPSRVSLQENWCLWVEGHE